jgi:hypothetical protein
MTERREDLTVNYIIDRIPGNVRIDPDAGGQERQRKRERPHQKNDAADSVSISDEARRRSAQKDEKEPEEGSD